MRITSLLCSLAALIFSVASSLSVAGASPPTSLCLVPSAYNAKVGDTLKISLVQGLGSGGNAEKTVTFESFPSSWFFLRVAAMQENRGSPLEMNVPAKPAPADPAAPAANPPPPAATTSVEFPLSTPGVAMIGCDLAPRVERLTVADLLVFLKASLTQQAYDELAPSLPATGDVRVRRVETVKTYVRVASNVPAASLDTQTAMTKVGQVNELRFMFDPTSTPIGSDVAFRVFANYDKVAKARVTIACHEAKVSQQLETDASGTAKFTISHDGAWRVEFHHAKTLNGDPDADLVISSATVTFHSTSKEAVR